MLRVTSRGGASLNRIGALLSSRRQSAPESVETPEFSLGVLPHGCGEDVHISPLAVSILLRSTVIACCRADGTARRLVWLGS